MIFNCFNFRNLVIMSKNLSNNYPLRSSDKKTIRNFPLDDRAVTPLFDEILPRLGKFISHDGECVILHQNNASQHDTMTSELLLLRFTDSENENDLKCAHKVFIDYR